MQRVRSAVFVKSAGRRFGLFAMVLGAMLTACSSGPRLQAQPRESLTLGGRWHLDPKSDDVSAKLQAALRVAPRDTSEDPEWDSEADGLSREADAVPRRQHRKPPAWLLRDEAEKEQALIEFLTPPAEIDIDQSAVSTDFMSADRPTRRFVVGEQSTLITSFATLRVTSGWERNAFVVYSSSRDPKVAITERYALADQGGALEQTIEAQLPRIGTQTFHLRYVRQTPASQRTP